MLLIIFKLFRTRKVRLQAEEIAELCEGEIIYEEKGSLVDRVSPGIVWSMIAIDDMPQ